MHWGPWAGPHRRSLCVAWQGAKLSACCACCKHDEEEEKGKKSAYVPAEKRSCHDLLFVLLFFTFWLGRFMIAAFAVAKGDPKK